MSETSESSHQMSNAPDQSDPAESNGPRRRKAPSARRNRKGEVFPSKKSSAVRARQEAAVKGSSALGQKARKVMQERLLEAGVKKERLPAIFRDKEIARSRKGAAGQIVVKDMSGVQSNAAAKIARKFENELTGGKDDIAEKLEMVPVERQTAVQKRLIQTMRSNPRWSFARCVAESKANLATSMNAYAEGLLALKKLESLMELYREMPHLMRDVMHHAIDQMEACNVCFGEGKVAGRAGGKSLNKTCPRCGGEGNVRVSSPHKAVALKEALEMSKLKPEKGPLVAVQNNQVNVAANDDGNLLERMAKATDDVLYGERDHQEETVDAEIVYPDDIPVD